MRPSPRPVLVPALCFVLFSALAALFLFRAEAMYDTDSYFHLFVGRVYRHAGLVDQFPWTRFSIYRDGFGDKEVLFHVLLAPFAGSGVSTGGGRLALALLIGGIAAALGALGRRAVGSWGFLAPLLVFFGSIDFLGRAIRLRPELLALLLFLAAAWCAAERRHRLLGLVALAFALAYTGFHALLALSGLWFAYSFVVERRREWLLLLYPILGTGLGLLLHPHFPHNLVVWKVQNVDFFLIASQLDVSTENRAPSLVAALRDNWGWAAACLGLWLGRGWLGVASTREDPGGRTAPEREHAVRELAVYAIATAAFALLYVLMLRFSIYFYSFGTLALLHAVRSFPSRERPVGRARLVASASLLAALVSVQAPARMLWGMATATGGELSREAEWAAAGRALPSGARVAADWGLTPNVLFFAPQAQFLNVLNSVFMAVPYPDEYRAWRRVVAGEAEDPVATICGPLDSDFLVVSRFFTSPRLLEQLRVSPRARPIHVGYTLVFRLDCQGATPAEGQPGPTEPTPSAPDPRKPPAP